MPSVADFLLKRVQENGWFSVGSLYFDNCYTLQPFEIDGRICLSPSAELIIAINNYDAIDSATLDDYLVHDERRIGYQQNIAIFGFEHLQHFAVNLFNLTHVYPSKVEEFPLPAIPTPDVINGITLDPETGLAADQSVARKITRKEIATMDLFPDLEISDASGARIKKLQDFYANQKQFAEAMNKFLGLSDCI